MNLSRPGCAGFLPLVLVTLMGAHAASPGWQSREGYRFLPLEPGSNASTGFKLLAPQVTGLRFTNQLPGRLAMANHNLMNGSGVAAGDFDGDGWCDLYFCAINGANALLHNRGDGSFEDVTARSPGLACEFTRSTGAVFADHDGDGDLDLFVNSLGQGTRCFLNDGAGRFQPGTEAAGVGAATGSTSLALADVTGDGALDLYVANYGAEALLKAGIEAPVGRVNGQLTIVGPHAARLRLAGTRVEELGEAGALFVNDGRGHFWRVATGGDAFLDEAGKPMALPPDFGLSVQMRDVNEDGWPDIYVCNDFQSPDRLWLNDRLGRFRAAPRLALRQRSYSSMGVDFADLDRDGRLDFFVVEMLSPRRQTRLRQLPAAPWLPAGRTPLDEVVEVGRNTLFWNRGDFTFAEIARFSGVAATDWSWQPVFLDVDLDGFEDLLVVNGHLHDVQDLDVLAHVTSLGKLTPRAAQEKLALYPALETPNVAFRNRGDLTFEDRSGAWGFDSTQISQGIALFDFDGDGDLDAAINCLNAPALLYRNESSAPRVAVRLRGKAPNTRGIGGRITLRGGAVPEQTQEIVCGGRYLSGDDTMRVFAAGSATNLMTLEVRWRSGARRVIADVRANRLYEIEETGGAGESPVPNAPAEAWFADASDRLPHTHHDEAFDDFARQPLLSRKLSELGPGAAWVDFDGDGREDLFVGAGRGGAPGIFRNLGNGALGKIDLGGVRLPDDLLGLAAWVGSSGRRELLGSLSGYESGRDCAVISFSHTPGGQLAARTVLTLRALAAPGPLAVADYDGDGDLDLFVGGRTVPGRWPESPASLLWRNQAGQFLPDIANNRALTNAGMIAGAVWSDLDGDAWPELVLACEWGPVRVFQNRAGALRESTADLGLAKSTGWWSSLATGDLDGDGRPEIIAGNWGHNTPWTASPEQPARLYHGDLGFDRVEVIEAEFDPALNQVAPRRPLNVLAAALPFLRTRAASHRQFAAASLDQLFGPARERLKELEAATLASTVFFNRGSHFEAVPLPREAQWAPVQAAGVADFDGDGAEDVFLAQNVSALAPDFERCHAGRGLWLRGDGKGGLTPIAAQASGVSVYGDQRAVALGDVDADGRVDLLVTQHGNGTRLFLNRRAQPGLRVRLSGPPGNPDGTGASIRLSFGGVAGAARELHAGAGGLSQHGTVQVLGGTRAPDGISVRWPGGGRLAAPLPPGAKEVVAEFSGTVRVLR